MMMRVKCCWVLHSSTKPPNDNKAAWLWGQTPSVNVLNLYV
jgi:hypothetical protein